MSNRTRSRLLSVASTRAVRAGIIAAAAFGVAASALAGPREQAQRIHDRIAGVPPSDAVLDEMEALVNQNRAFDAALLATEDRHFYTVTLKNFAAPWTNRDQ